MITNAGWRSRARDFMVGDDAIDVGKVQMERSTGLQVSGERLPQRAQRKTAKIAKKSREQTTIEKHGLYSLILFGRRQMGQKRIQSTRRVFGVIEFRI